MACCEKKTKNIDMFHLKYHPLLKKKKKKALRKRWGKKGLVKRGETLKGN